MTVKLIPDKWNSEKIWIIKRYSDGHYYLNQSIKGRVFNRAYQRVTLNQIRSILSD